MGVGVSSGFPVPDGCTRPAIEIVGQEFFRVWIGRAKSSMTITSGGQTDEFEPLSFSFLIRALRHIQRDAPVL
jgi:hypothetical protein